MTKISIDIRAFGMPSYKKKLLKIAASIDDLEKPIRKAGEIALALVRSYPPYGDWENGKISFVTVRPGAKYKRTKTLQKNWKGRMNKGGKATYIYRVWNYHTVDPRGRAYLGYVQGDDQAPIHVGVWYTEKEMNDMLRKTTLEIFRRFMKDATRP